jgi:hypothetical protein
LISPDLVNKCNGKSCIFKILFILLLLLLILVGGVVGEGEWNKFNNKCWSCCEQNYIFYVYI